jgi:hypothetical protein
MCSEAGSDTGKEVKRLYLGKEENCGKQHLRERWTMQEYDIMNRLLGRKNIQSSDGTTSVQSYISVIRLAWMPPVHCFMLGT